MNFGRIITFIAIGIVGVYSFCQAIHSTYKFDKIEKTIRENMEYVEHMNTIHRLYCDDLKYICDSLGKQDSIFISKYDSLIKEINKSDSLLNRRVVRKENTIKNKNINFKK